MRKNKEVHTTISPEIYKLAVLNDISWGDALSLGIEIRSDYKQSDEGKLMKEKKDLEEQIRTIQAKVKFIEEQLQNLHAHKEKATKKESDGQLELKKKMLRALKLNNPLRQSR